MDLRDGRKKIKTLDRGDYCAQAELSRYGRIGQAGVDGIHSGVRGRCSRKPNTPCERKRNSSIQNIQPSEQDGNVSWNGDVNHPGTIYKKCTNQVTFLVDTYTLWVYINFNNNPTKNKKARLAPGSEVNLRLTPKRFLSPLLFAVNQKF
ncbi:hypothetical protein LEP1GSC073_2714 [Leptospira noguchii str. Cascata]|nr:hypothetical protein LEP1GSC073_2714 [Leptospira noguchii str. Cascata]